MIARRPGFATVAVLTLALGLGTMTVAFSAVNAFFIVRPPIEAAGAGLVVVDDGSPESGGASFRELDAFGRDVPALVIAGQAIVTMSRRAGDTATVAWGLAVTDNYFSVLATTAAIGRTFTAGDPLAVVISDRFWRRTLGAAPLAGLSVRLNGVDVPVLGVLPAAFRAGFYDAEMWVRIADWQALRLPSRLRAADASPLTLFARLADGATTALANAQLGAAAHDLAQTRVAGPSRTPRFVSFAEGIPELRALAVVAMAAMAMIAVVLLIAIFNVVGLFLSHAVQRRREMGMRGALGASRGQLVQQLVTETALLASIAAVVAFLVARWSNELLAGFAPEAPIPQRLDVTPDWHVALFTLVLTVLCGVGAGMLPAWRATRLSLVTVLGAGTSTADAHRMRGVIVASQIAGATLLLVLAAMLVRTAMRDAAVDVGFDTAHTAVLELDPATAGYTNAAAPVVIDDLLRALRLMPGVAGAAVTDRVPFYVGFPNRVEVAVDGSSCVGRPCRTVGVYYVGPDYFRTIGIPLLRGRAPGDGAGARDEIVISTTMARQFWPDRDPLGATLTVGRERRDFRVVGVAADVIHRAVSERPEAYVYLPMPPQSYAAPLAIVLRTTLDPEPQLPLIANRVKALDRDLPVHRLRTMRQRIEVRQQAGAAIVARFFAVCGGLAVFLAVVGLAGTVSYMVTARTRDLGIRAALGATPQRLRRLVLSDALWMAVPGVSVGLASAFLVGRLVAAQLRAVQVDGPVAYVIVGALQLAITVAAVAMPARRASRVDPLSTLRAD